MGVETPHISDQRVWQAARLNGHQPHTFRGRFLYLTSFLINILILIASENNLHPVAIFGRVIGNGATKKGYRMQIIFWGHIVAPHALA
jgi:hypothetical protein